MPHVIFRLGMINEEEYRAIVLKALRRLPTNRPLVKEKIDRFARRYVKVFKERELVKKIKTMKKLKK